MLPQRCLQESAGVRIVRASAKPSKALNRELLKSLAVAEAAWRTSPETIQVHPLPLFPPATSSNPPPPPSLSLSPYP
jgi:hypothetical protein